MAKVEIKSSEDLAMKLGTTGFEGDFANGEAYKAWAEGRRISSVAGLTDEEKVFINEKVEPICAKMNDWEISQSPEYRVSDDLLQEMKDAGLWGICMPREYGGLGFSVQAEGAILQKMIGRSFAGTIPMMVVNSLGTGKFVLSYGSERQKKELLPLIASGHYTTFFGATETRAASDIFSTETTGTIEKDEKGELYLDVKNADKRYITNIGIANLGAIFVNTKDPHNYLGRNTVDIGTSCGLITPETPGVVMDKRLKPPAAFANGVIQGSFKIPLKDIIGEEDGLGKGELMMQMGLAKARGISVPNGSTAAMRVAAYTVGAFVGARAQFGRTLKDIEGLCEPLAQVAGSAYLAQAISSVAAKTVDDGGTPSISAGIAKNLSVDLMRDALHEVDRVLCGKGVMMGPSNFIRLAIDSIAVADAVEGAHHVTEWANGIQGLMRTHKHARHAIDPAMEILGAKGLGGKIKAAKRNSSALSEHIIPMGLNTIKNYFVARMPESLHSETQGDVDPKTQHYYNHINRMSRSYNMIGSAMLMHHRENAVARGNTLKRLGRIMAYNYAAACALNEFEAKGRPEEERDMLDWAVQRCMFKAEEALEELIDNYPKKKYKYVTENGCTEKVSEKSWLMSGFIRASYGPNARQWKSGDFLDHRIARGLTQPGSATRNFMADTIYIPTDATKEPIAICDVALEKWAKVREIMLEAKKEKRKEYTPEERDIIRDAEIAQSRMVAVDEYDLNMNLVRTAAEHKGFAANMA
jgi:acyl-CoA dehydrogenase